MAVDFEPGVVLAGHYRLDRVISRGGMGVVWAATDTETQRAVALKHLRSDAADDDETKRRFFREAQAMGVLSHPNIVTILDVARTPDGLPVLVMELLEGEPLSARLHRVRRLSLADAAGILLPVVSAVGRAHSMGIVHRDLKPENIFLCSASTGAGAPAVKVLDFGIAKVTTTAPHASSVITGTWALLGTPYYMSPEQIVGERDIDHRSDIWALGVILYECLAGVRPSEAKTPGKIFEVILLKGIRPLAEVVPGVPAEVAKLVGKMLSRERVDRPSDLREVLAVLERYTSVKAPRFGPPAPARLSEEGELSAPARRPRLPDDDEDDSLNLDLDDMGPLAHSQPPSTLPAPSPRLSPEMPPESKRRNEIETLPPRAPPPLTPEAALAMRAKAAVPAARATQSGVSMDAPRVGGRSTKASLAIVVGALVAGGVVGTLMVRGAAQNGMQGPSGPSGTASAGTGDCPADQDAGAPAGDAGSAPRCPQKGK